MESRSTFSDLLLSWRSLLLQPFRALLDCLLLSELSRLDQGDTISSMVSDHTQNYKYDVFISFRGPDSRKTFVDHLYGHLIGKGISTFKDDERLEKGEALSPQLTQAIQNSRVSIVVFSEKYAESRWCLEEMDIIAGRQKNFKQAVFPVFYNVDPSHVRKQSGVYKEAFDLHMKKHNPDKVRRWKKSMLDLGTLVGWDVRNEPEFKEIKHIVQEVIKTLGHRFSPFADDLIGIQPRVEALESLLNLSSAHIRVIGIWGMGGVGKTTLANVMYDRISYQFDACCFIENVSKIYRDGGAIAIHKQILRQTVDEIYLDRYSASQISGIVSRGLCKKNVLVVLDNVDLLEQVQELAINPGLLGDGSRMIITTRNKRILELYGAYIVDVDHLVHEVPLLNHNDACELFHRKAFKSGASTIKCEELTVKSSEKSQSDSANSPFLILTPEVLRYAQGLPLAVGVLGSSLYDRNAAFWGQALSSLKSNPNVQIMDVLQVSFEGLELDDREIFLHIACFFKGEKEDYVKRVLDACELNPHIGVQRLIERSLITIRNQEVHMHEMLQELGKKIVEQQFPKEPGSWSRLWLYKDFHIVTVTETGTNKVHAIVLDKKEDISVYSLLRIEGLSRMPGLTILILYHKNKKFSGRLSFLSNNLQYLLWYDYPFASLPLNFEPVRLVELNMPCSNIRQLWDGSKDLPNLKRLDLSNSKNLLETPDFEKSRKLERIDLTGCTKLVDVHSSIGLLDKLAFLSLEGCRSLRFLNIDEDNASNLCSLKVLHLSGCSTLETLPDFTRASNLEYLDADQCTNLVYFGSSIGALTKLIFLSLRDCTNLLTISGSVNIDSLRSLVTLDLCGCLKLENMSRLNSFYMIPLIFLDLGLCSLTTVPDAIGELTYLERLNLEGNDFSSLPDSIGMLRRLAYLNLEHCTRLKSLPELQMCATSVSGGRYFKVVSGSHNHRSGLYIFNCPLLVIRSELRDFHMLALSWLKRLVENPCHFRCGFDIVVPGDTIPQWFDHQFVESSRVKIANSTDENDNWIGFAFCVAFKENSGSTIPGSPRYSFSSQLPYPLYLSFENEHIEETFDIPLQLDPNIVDSSHDEHLWLIYISRQHCHFVATGVDITFKACPSITIRKWGIRKVLEHDIFNPFELWTNEVSENQIGFHRMDYEHEGSSSNSPVIKLPYNWDVPKDEAEHKIQLNYNWQVTEEEENENMEVITKENNLYNIGFS